MDYLNGNNIRLVRFTDEHITDEYISWTNNQNTNRYLEMWRIPVIKDEIFIPDIKATILFAILSSKYIGTATIHNIDYINRNAEIGYVIGDIDSRNKGLATETIKLLSNYSFEKLGLNKLNATVVDGNIGSIKSLENNEFKLFGRNIRDYYLKGKFYDNLMYVKLKNKA